MKKFNLDYMNNNNNNKVFIHQKMMMMMMMIYKLYFSVRSSSWPCKA